MILLTLHRDPEPSVHGNRNSRVFRGYGWSAWTVAVYWFRASVPLDEEVLKINDVSFTEI